MEQEGLNTSRVGVGLCSTGNVELLFSMAYGREKMHETIQTAKMLGIGKDELAAMMEILAKRVNEFGRYLKVS